MQTPAGTERGSDVPEGRNRVREENCAEPADHHVELARPEVLDLGIGLPELRVVDPAGTGTRAASSTVGSEVHAKDFPPGQRRRPRVVTSSAAATDARTRSPFGSPAAFDSTLATVP